MRFYRVSDVWFQQGQGKEIEVVLDFNGDSAGSQPITVGTEALALITAMMAQGKPVYYSMESGAISTDPTFGSNGYDPKERTHTGVTDVDVTWDVAGRRGVFALTLENRSVVSMEFNDPALGAAWMAEMLVHDVAFDGDNLLTIRDIGQ